MTEISKELHEALSEIVDSRYLNDWLYTPNSAFDNLKPIELLERGEADRLWSMIYYIRSGMPT